MNLKCFITLCASLLCSLPSHGQYRNDWDRDFKGAAEIFMPYAPWQLLKAQCIAESALDPLAVSPVGAQGLCQFMPNTWADMQRRDASFINPFDPEASIYAAAMYMADLNRFWRSPRPFEDRYCLAMASYNAGAGNLVKAQKLATDKVHCKPIMCELHRVTGHHSKETNEYVRRIMRIYPQLLLD